MVSKRRSKKQAPFWRGRTGAREWAGEMGRRPRPGSRNPDNGGEEEPHGGGSPPSLARLLLAVANAMVELVGRRTGEGVFVIHLLPRGC